MLSKIKACQVFLGCKVACCGVLLYTAHMGVNDMADELETTDFAADFLKVHPETVRRLIRSGELPAVKVGRNWRVRRSDLQRILERGTEEVQP